MAKPTFDRAASAATRTSFDGSPASGSVERGARRACHHPGSHFEQNPTGAPLERRFIFVTETVNRLSMAELRARWNSASSVEQIDADGRRGRGDHARARPPDLSSTWSNAMRAAPAATTSPSLSQQRNSQPGLSRCKFSIRSDTRVAARGMREFLVFALLRVR
jgi:hypothetical protein